MEDQSQYCTFSETANTPQQFSGVLINCSCKTFRQMRLQLKNLTRKHSFIEILLLVFQKGPSEFSFHLQIYLQCCLIFCTCQPQIAVFWQELVSDFERFKVSEYFMMEDLLLLASEKCFDFSCRKTFFSRALYIAIIIIKGKSSLSLLFLLRNNNLTSFILPEFLICFCAFYLAPKYLQKC